jgi:galactokinase
MDWLPAWENGAGAERAGTGFRHTFGCAPAGVWAAPGRVNVIGEHVDYNGGLCLPIALPHRTFVALRPRDDGEIRLFSAQLPEPWTSDLSEVAPGTVSGWGTYAAGVAWALSQLVGRQMPGFEAYVDSCVPFGAGLSSSAALECAVAVALDELVGLEMAATDAGRAALAAACVRAENEIAGAPTGGMDQAASLRSLAGAALVLDCRSNEVAPVPFDLAAAGLELLVTDTRAKHALGDGQYGNRRAACEEAARLLGVATLRDVADLDAALAALAGRPELVPRVRHVVTEIARTSEVVSLLRSGRVRDVGPLLDASHESLRLDYEVSAPELDAAVAAAREAGALGARMTGGGFGGSAIALVPAGSGAGVAEAVSRRFADSGFKPPAFLDATASAGAERVA